MSRKWALFVLLAIFILFVIGLAVLRWVPPEQLNAMINADRIAYFRDAAMFGAIASGCLLVGVLVGAKLSGRSRGEKASAASVPQQADTIVTVKHSADVPVVPANAQHIGSRKEQQDAFCFSEALDAETVGRIGVMAVVADGMGGLAMGREASRLAAQMLLSEYIIKLAGEPIAQALHRAIVRANEEVYEMAKRNGLEWNTGTTMVAGVIHNRELYWISTGDSRMYLYRDGALTQLTTDHVYARKLNEDVLLGRMSREEAETHPDRGSLTSYLGLPELIEVDRNVKPYPLRSGDRIILCSDGFYGALTETEIIEAQKQPPQEAADSLLRTVISKQIPNQDNATVAILAC